MNLLAPAHLWLLLALPVVWWLSLPSRPRQVTLTPHLAQWRLALAALRRRPPRFSRLRFLLLAAALAAAVLAFAQPVLPAPPGPQRLAVVLDASASMAACDVSGVSAWSRARAVLQRTLAGVPDHVEVTLLGAGGALWRRHGAFARSLHDLGQPGGELAVDLPKLAATIGEDPATAVWTLTDGQGQAALPTSGALSVLPAAGPNAAVLAVRLEDRWPLPTFTLIVDVLAHAAAMVKGELTVQGAIAAPQARAVELSPGTVHRETFELERTTAGGAVRVRLAVPGDVLDTDDGWEAVLPPLPAPRIGYLADDDGDGGTFARVAVQALAEEVGGSVVPVIAGREVGLLLLDGGSSRLAAGQVRALTFGTRLGDAPEPALWRLPVVADWDRGAVLTAGLDLSELRVERAWRGVLPAGEAFLWADEAGERVPLAVVVGTGDVASVHFAFRLQDSTLPLLPAFPQLLRRAFVRAYGPGAAPRVRTAPPAAGELDLQRPATGVDRPLPAFGGAPRDLAPWCLVLGLWALALRAFVR